MGTGRPTLNDVARKAGVSACLVSKLINGKDAGASKETRCRVFAAAKLLGYKPNISARRLAGASRDSIGVFFDRDSDFKHPFLTTALNAIILRAEDLGYSVNVGMAGTGDKLKLLEKGVIDSAILVHSNAHSCEELGARFEKESLPTVFLNPGYPMPVNAVLCDDNAGMDLAVAHLRSLGHGKIAFVAEVSAHASYATRVRRIEVLGAGCHLIQLPDNSGVEEFQGVLADMEASACIVVEDMLTPLYMACHAGGIEIPVDISVVGINDGIDQKALAPKATMIKIPMLDMAVRAVDMLDESMRVGKPVESVVYQETLVERASCVAPLCKDL